MSALVAISAVVQIILQDVIMDPFNRGGVAPEFKISVLVKGGGSHGQAEAVRHGITRALVEIDAEQRSPLKKLGFLILLNYFGYILSNNN